MKKLILKHTLARLSLITLCITSCLSTSQAQSNFYKIGLGAGAGITQSFADVYKKDFGSAFYGTADYYFTPFLSLGLEAQQGTIKGGDVNTDPHGRQFKNNYRALNLNGKLQLGALVDYQHSRFANAIKGLYAGLGIGAIQHRHRNPIRTREGDNYYFPGKDFSKEIFAPLNIGINFYFPDFSGTYRYVLNANYQTNVTFGEGLDGYDDSIRTLKSGNPDIYTYFSIGLKYQFGPVGISSKSFRKP